MDGTHSWEWGGFPSLSQTNTPISENPRQEERKSMLSGMFSFMKQKHSSQNPLEGGMYLSEITSGRVDEEVAEIYFNQSKEKKGNGTIYKKYVHIICVTVKWKEWSTYISEFDDIAMVFRVMEKRLICKSCG